MEVNILKEDKKELDVEIDNLTIAELLRNYLNKDDVKLAAWRRDHPSKNPVLHIEADNPKKALKSAISRVEKDIESLSKEFKDSI